MTQLTDNLYAVEVPEDANNFWVSENGLSAWNNGLIMYSSIPSGNWSIIGTVTKDSIDFDCGGYVEYKSVQYNNVNEGVGEDIIYKNYNTELFSEYPDDSFRSLLTSKGLTDYNKLVIIKSK